MIALLVNDTRIEAATCWEDKGTTRIYTALMREKVKASEDGQEPDPAEALIRIFNIITGQNFTGLLDESSQELEMTIYQCVAFVANQERAFLKMPKPSAVRIAGKIIDIPTDIQALTIAQNFHLRSALMTAPNLDCLVAFAMAVYLQPLVDGTKFSLARAKEIEQELMARSIEEVFPVGFFLLARLTDYGSDGLPSFAQVIRRTANSFKPWRRPLTINASNLSTTSASLTPTGGPTANSRGTSWRSHLMKSCRSFFYGRNRMNTVNVITPSTKS